MSWSTVAKQIGCTVSAARRACQKGVAGGHQQPAEKSAS
jgi:hypothetical protein